MKKTAKIIAGIIAIVLIGILLFFANGLLGNPVSKALAERSAKKHIEKNYPEMGLVVESTGYNFKTGGYYSKIKSPDSIDTHFSLDISLTGKIINDMYENSVLNKWNTLHRIDSEYRAMADKIFDSPLFPYPSEICYGIIETTDSDTEAMYPEANFGIPLDSLEIDKIYDLKEVAKSAGRIVFYAQSEQVTNERASEILLDLKRIFDEAGLTFYAVDFNLEKPRNEAGASNEDGSQIGVSVFPYSDIYEENMVERFSLAAKKQADYYAQKDAEKAVESKGQSAQ